MPNALFRLLDAPGARRVLALVLIGAGALATVWGFTRWGMTPAWVPVASGLPLERVDDVIQRLGEAGVPYRLERGGGLVTVPERDLARARVTLAADGLAGAAVRPGFELFDEPSWGMTDFAQRVNLRRALEGELERTISGMREVERAQVHLAMEETSLLRKRDPAGEASVVLHLRSGARAADPLVEGVRSLVAGAVEGLSPADVTVLDDRGRLLSPPDDGGASGLTATQLRVRREIEEYLERKAEAVVERVVGRGNVTVRVSATLNFDRLDRTVQAVDPDRQLVVSEDRAEITPGDDAQGAASVTTNTVFETTRSVETLQRGGARVERLTVAVVVAERAGDGVGGARSAGPPAPEEIARVEALARDAVGLVPERGDRISVASAPPIPPELPVVAEPGVDVGALVMEARRPVVALAGLATALVLTLRLLAAVQERAPAGRAPLPSGGERGLDPGERERPGLEPPAEEAPVERRSNVQIADAEMTARVLRSWMKEA